MAEKDKCCAVASSSSGSNVDKKNLLLLFDRPQEPVFMGKGAKGSVFDVPSEFLDDRYKNIGADLQTRYAENASEIIPVRTDISIPDLALPMSLGRHEQFSLFIPRHRKIATRLVEIFLGLSTIEELQAVAVYSRDRLNPFLFNYALSSAILNRPDTKDLSIPLFIETFPEKFIDSKVFAQIREEVSVVPDGSRRPIEIPSEFTSDDLDEEHSLAYFREDIGINLHHWHWHLVYPYEAPFQSLVDKDRRGELFYYMHQQIMARYNFERFSHNMSRAIAYKSLREPISEAYFPKMDSLVSSRAWPARSANTKLSDLDQQLDRIQMDVSELESWAARFHEACNTDTALDSTGKTVHLDEKNGIDYLGNMMESTTVSINREYYGNLHNIGHIFIAYAHDPDNRHRESFGVIGDSATAVRDPAFYRWHAFIDDHFQVHKKRLRPYSVEQLGYPDILITDATVKTDDDETNGILHTFWQQSDVNLAQGLDFLPRGNVFARFTHLQHNPFTFIVNVNNKKEAAAKGTVRIFIAPKTDERGQPIPLVEQRRLMAEMDRFTATLNPGENIIRRKSTESNVTIPHDQTFRNIDRTRPEGNPTDAYNYNFCGCGWPSHMLVPSGKKGDGMSCELFVMITNNDEDRVDQDLSGTCRDAFAFCGIRDKKYPDKRAMGFPFDRFPREDTEFLADFLTPNMHVTQFKIVHSDKTVQRMPRTDDMKHK